MAQKVPPPGRFYIQDDRAVVFCVTYTGDLGKMVRTVSSVGDGIPFPLEFPVKMHSDGFGGRIHVLRVLENSAKETMWGLLASKVSLYCSMFWAYCAKALAIWGI